MSKEVKNLTETRYRLKHKQQLENLPWDLKKQRSEYEIDSQSTTREKIKPKKTGKIEITLHEAKILAALPVDKKSIPEVVCGISFGFLDRKSSPGVMNKYFNHMLWTEPEKITLIVLDLNKAKSQSIDLSIIEDTKGKGIGMVTLQYNDYIHNYETPQFIQLRSGDVTAELKISIRTYGLSN
eukprot:gene10071-2492_t